MGKNIRWIIVLLLFLVYMINYLDRVALSITVPMIEKDLALNAEQFGIIFGSFFFGYAVFNFIGGLAVDKFGATLVMGLAVGLWSLFCGLTAVATGFYSMLVLRVLFGMAEGPICASANKMINGWFPKKQAATAVGFLSAGSPLGGAVAGPIVGYLALAFGWRPAFMIIFAIGIVWMIAWFFIAANSPEKHKKVSHVGLALGGYISDKIFKLTGRLLLSRKIVLVVCLLMAAICVGLAGTVSSVVPAVLLMSVSIFFLYVTGAIYWAIIQDVVHKSRVGGASGFIHLIGSVSGIVGPIVTGYIVQSTGKFDSAFVLAGTIAALGALLVLFVIKTPRVTMKASQA